MNSLKDKCCNRRLLYIIFLGLLICNTRTSLSQITVGYRNPIVSSASSGIQINQTAKLTNQLKISGENVVPIDGVLNFHRQSEWKINDTQRGFKLNIEDMNPMIEDESTFAKSRTTSASRRELIPISVSGPAAQALRSVFPVTQRLIELETFEPTLIGF